MPPKKSEPAPDGGNPVWWFIAIMIGLFLVWLFGGGPQRYEARHPELIPTTYEKNQTESIEIIEPTDLEFVPEVSR